MTQKKRMFAFHLLNDRSGSPKVLRQVVKACLKSEIEVNLYTSLHQEGFLSNIAGVNYHNGWYRFQSNPWIRLIYFSLSQILLFIKMYKTIRKTDLIYINTVLPFGAAILGMFKGCRVIYHIHECTVNPPILKWFLFKVVKWTASEIINVSNHVAVSHGINEIPNHLVYNAIEDAFLSEVLPKEQNHDPNTVLMVCSLKAYKGIHEFVRLAEDNPNFNFQMVLNASADELNSFFKAQTLPANLLLSPSQPNLHPFFQKADIIVNLSRPDGWVETFGLTIIEGMAYGLPAIVPKVGGILEVIEEDISGFSVDSRDRSLLNAVIKYLMTNAYRYKHMSLAAQNRLNMFREEVFEKNIMQLIK
jgi:L-malate glycosyltransferase